MKKPVDLSPDAVALAALPSLGPTSAKMLIEAGVKDVRALKRLGAVGAYRALRFRFGRRVSMNFVYAIECGLRGLDWRALEKDRKAELKAQAQAQAALAELEKEESDAVLGR